MSNNMQIILKNFENYLENLSESKTPKKDKKYSACQKKDVDDGLCDEQFHATFGSETVIEIDDEKTVKDKKYYLLKITKPDHEPKYGWKAADEVDGRLKPYEEQQKKGKDKEKDK